MRIGSVAGVVRVGVGLGCGLCNGEELTSWLVTRVVASYCRWQSVGTCGLFLVFETTGSGDAG